MLFISKKEAQNRLKRLVKHSYDITRSAPEGFYDEITPIKKESEEEFIKYAAKEFYADIDMFMESGRLLMYERRKISDEDWHFLVKTLPGVLFQVYREVRVFDQELGNIPNKKLLSIIDECRFNLLEIMKKISEIEDKAGVKLCWIQ